MGAVLLITGRPGVGKTTLFRRIADELRHVAGGFYTMEMRESGERVGFRLVTLEGRRATFAHVKWARQSNHRVGRYGVDVEVLDRIGVAAVREAIRRRRVVMVDEIGKMELFSAAFRTVIKDAAESPKHMIATITSAPHPWADAFKRRRGVTVYEVTRANRDGMPEKVHAWLRARNGSNPG